MLEGGSVALLLELAALVARRDRPTVLSPARVWERELCRGGLWVL